MARKDETDATLSVDDKFELLINALTARQGGMDPEALKAIILETQRTARKEAKPENETHPGKSCFSYAEGDVARPRPVLGHEFYYNAYPMHKFPETEHWRELELASQVVPGTYKVIRRDGTPMPVEVKGDRNVDGKLTSVRVEFSVSREEKALVPPKAVLLYQLVYNDNPRLRFVEAMTEHLSMVMGEPAAV